ncbi:acylphosphatase [Methanospirillum hungatei]|uniref:acylphosphatase n=1 Tax=Methanospirillum hungatei TaxID=2203 RepID=UPI0026EC622A|nr:acylphosphatase [Methanospirillum hungatei]MCA1914830.1 acylphosphatase [Methanospirillum hungatei]
MKKRIVIAGPRVHNVGYRPFLLQYAQVHGFTHFFAINNSYNGEQEVLITISETEEKISSFISYISSNKPDFAEVTEIRSEEYTGDVVPIGTFLQDLQFEQLCKGIPAILRIEEAQHEMISLQKTMLTKQDQMLHKQDQMIEKQDQIIHIQQDTVDEIKGFRKDSTNYLETEFSDIKKKLQAIENALSREGIRV